MIGDDILRELSIRVPIILNRYRKGRTRRFYDFIEQERMEEEWRQIYGCLQYLIYEWEAPDTDLTEYENLISGYIACYWIYQYPGIPRTHFDDIIQDIKDTLDIIIVDRFPRIFY